MIIEALLDIIGFLVKTIFAFINIPDMPAEVSEPISQYLNLVFDNLGFLGFFVHINVLKIVAITAIALVTFERLYKITLWIYHKLPISSN